MCVGFYIYSTINIVIWEKYLPKDLLQLLL